MDQGVESGDCQPVIDALDAPFDRSINDTINAAIDFYIVLYRGAAEGCLGDLGNARIHLGDAKEREPALDRNNNAIDGSCQPELLLAWAYATFLNESVSLACTPQ